MGHKTVHKALTGRKITSTDRFTGRVFTSLLYRWERTSFCIRCGEIVHKDNPPTGLVSK